MVQGWTPMCQRFVDPAVAAPPHGFPREAYRMDL